MLFVPDFDLAVYEKPRIELVASAALEAAPRSVTSAVNPRSAGGPHDFPSEGDYWWPDPKNPDGPFIQRDGLSNPGNFVAHRQLMMDMARDTGALATGNAEWLATWKQLESDPQVEEVRRNFPIREPVLWVK